MKSKFKYTASDTPQHNLYTEMGFTALAGMSRAVMNVGNVPRAIRYKLFGEVTKTATKLDSLVLVEIDGVKKTCVEHYTSLIPNWVKYMKTFGKAGTIRTGKDGKVGDSGVTLMIVGYADNHEGNCYQMFNPPPGTALRNHVM